MRLVAVTDIFGRTSCLEELLSALSAKYESIEIVDPYEGVEIPFKDEDEAYDHFQQTIGLDGYIEKLSRYLINNGQYFKNHLLGFSVGASAVWAASGMPDIDKRTKGLCFYGSQIRNLLHVQPKIEMDLYFPKMEPGFNVDEVIATLAKKDKVYCFQTSYLHGFMNKKSKNFDEAGYTEYIGILNRILFNT